MNKLTEAPVFVRGMRFFFDSTGHDEATAQRRKIAHRADYCVRWLKDQGFEVLGVEDGPRIIIRNCALCDEFEGAVEGYSRGRLGEQRYKAVIRLDCEVSWRTA
jgi:hypothetical protein